MVTDVEAKIAAVGGLYPEFQGSTVAWASPVTGEAQYWAVGPATPPMRFLATLGFQVPAPLAEVIGDKDSAQISHEQLHLLDVDVLIYQGRSEEGVQTFESDPLYRQLRAAIENRTVFFSNTADPVYAALSFSTVLSLSFAARRVDAAPGSGRRRQSRHHGYDRQGVRLSRDDRAQVRVDHDCGASATRPVPGLQRTGRDPRTGRQANRRPPLVWR